MWQATHTLASSRWSNSCWWRFSVHDGEHVARVAAGFRLGSLAWQVAMLHDHVEDGLLSPSDLEHMYGGLVAREVLVLTRRSDETYAMYIGRVKEHGGIARRVKIADLRDNLARSRVDRPSLAKRYERALVALGA
jgi:hypothetical protein